MIEEALLLQGGQFEATAILYDMSMVNGDNLGVNNLPKLTEEATYDGTKRSSLVDNIKTEYSVLEDWNIQTKKTSFLVDFEYTSLDGENSIWLMNDRLIDVDGRFQLVYDKNNNRFSLTIFTDSSNFKNFRYSINLAANTRIKAEFIYDDDNYSCGLFVNDVDLTGSITESETGTFSGIRSGTSGRLTIGERGWSPNLSNLIGYMYQATITRIID